jgi:nicotinamidase-related amidase
VAPADGDVVITKGGWSTFTDTGLAEKLRDQRITQVVVVGLSSTFGVESTARSAYDEGFDVVFATDAITGQSEAAHDAAVAGIYRILGETGTTAEILALLEQ